MMSYVVPVKKIIFAKYVQDWCKLPYGEYRLKSGAIRYTNPCGCKMYGTRPECPPRAEYFSDIVNLDAYERDELLPDITNTDIFLLREGEESTIFLIVREFDLEAHMKELERRHNDWSEKQLACVYYYQPSLDKQLRIDAEEFIANEHPPDPIVLTRPEAHGVNLFATCAFHGIVLKRKYPLKIVKKMVMVAKNKFSIGEWFL